MISFFFATVAYKDVENYILSLKNKSSDITTVPAKVLKFVRIIISPVLSEIINDSFSQGIFPDSLKIAKVIPLFKDGLKSQLSNYRPISLLPLISKIFEK